MWGYLAPARLQYIDEAPSATGVIRQVDADFQVDEVLGFDLKGAGQHQWLRLEKRSLSTEDLARCLARAAGISRHQVSYAGLKDRRAQTRQWFSIDLAGTTPPDWQAVLPDGCRLLEATWHRRKLRRGGLKRNRFQLRVRDVAGDTRNIETRLSRVGAGGVPNYFGPQRFGIDGGNVARAWALLACGERVRDRHRRSLYLSTARSLLFNRVLSERVKLGNWNVPLDGDVMMLEGSTAVFQESQVAPELVDRCARLDIHPTGPLWGKGESRSQARALEVEQAALDECQDWCRGLARAGLEHGRRAFRLRVAELEWEWPEPAQLLLRFSLPAGGYATSVLREIISASTART